MGIWGGSVGERKSVVKAVVGVLGGNRGTFKRSFKWQNMQAREGWNQLGGESREKG